MMRRFQGTMVVQLSTPAIAKAVTENALKTLGITGLVKHVIGRHDCGGVRWVDQSVAANVAHVELIVRSWLPHLGDITGEVGAEIGPGDNIAASALLVARGASQMYAIEQYDSIADTSHLLAALGASADRVSIVRAAFEDFRPSAPLDFLVSYDVLEHVNPHTVFPHAFALLKPGGHFVNIVDFTGHGPFYNLQRPLDFLTCPDWLWRAMFSSMETTNRVRYSQMLSIARAAGFEIVSAAPIRSATNEYLASIRPHLLPRYAALGDDDLSVMQCLIHARKPVTATFTKL